MKKIILYLFLALFISANFACTEVGKNNQAANGDIKTKENNFAADESNDEAIKDEVKSEVNTSETAEKPTKPNSPEGLVDELYKEEEKDNTPFFQNKDRALVDKYFAKGLADLIWKDAVETNDDEAGKIDFDPLYDAQDAEVADLKVGNSEIKGEKATVSVTFLNFGEEQSVKYLLTKENGKWKIEDIAYEEGSLAKILKEDNPTSKKANDE